MVKFEFYLGDDDTDRVFLLKQMAEKDDLTANEYARDLLEQYLHTLYPKKPKRDDNGNFIL